MPNKKNKVKRMNLTVQELKIEDTGFSSGEIKRTRKKLKKAGIPKEYWFVEIMDRETGLIRKYLF